MKGNKETRRKVSIINAVASACVFGTGLIMFFSFHVGHGSRNEMLWGLDKSLWVNFHRAAAIVFLCGFPVHITLHWKYIRTIASRWENGLSQKVRKTSREQILLFIFVTIVLSAGFIAWAALPGGIKETTESRHHLIDIHNVSGLIALAGLAVHISRRWSRMFNRRKRDGNAIPRMGVAGVIFHNPFGRHHSTEYVQINLKMCDACGKCAAVCRKGVLELMDIRIHSHVHVSHAGKCTGCRKCVAACPAGAVTPAPLKAANG